MPPPLGELPKLRRRTLAGLAAFLAAQPAGEIVHAGGRDVGQGAVRI
jgi:hypothetical protein